jgi:hypothetical protein
MTTVIITIALFVVGALLTASPRVPLRALGLVLMVPMLFLWFGLSVLCGDGPLMHCAVLQ